MAVLCTLSALAIIAGAAVARRLYRESLAEAALAASMITLALVLVPIQVLGWIGELDRVTLGVSVLLLTLGVVAGLLAMEPRGARFTTLAADVRSILFVPIDAMRIAWRARSSAVVLAPFVVGILLWTTWLAWLAPSGGWDGLWYHEPMVGFAIQNRGFELVEVSHALEWVNAYPRSSENLMLWVTIFSDRRLIDAIPGLMAGISVLGFVSIVKPHGDWRAGALGLSCVLVTIPGVILQMRSTYVDVAVLAGYLAALHFATRPGIRACDLWLAGIALGFLGGAKPTGIAYVALIGGVALVRAIALAVRTRDARTYLHAFGAIVVIAILAAPTYVRNWVLHENPIWPLRYHSQLLGVTFEGDWDIADMQWPLGQVLEEMFGPPRPGEDYHDTRRHAYGYGLTFIGLPLLVLGVVAASARALRAGATRDRGALAREGRLLVLVALGAFPMLTSPAYHWARYALPTPAIALVVVFALLARPRMRTLGEAAIGAMGALNLIALFWAVPGWDVTVRTGLELASQPRDERVHARVSNNFVSEEASRLREQEIGPGDVVVYDDQILFVGNLWNEEMSNRVLFVPFTSRAEYLARLDGLEAEWVMVRAGSAEEAALRASEGVYERLAAGQGDDVIWARTSLPR